MEEFLITVDYDNQVTIIKHIESGVEMQVSLEFRVIDCIRMVLTKRNSEIEQ